MKIAIMGAGGRMGRALIKAVHEQDGSTVAAAFEREGSPLIGQDAGNVAAIGTLNVSITSDIAAGIAQSGAEAVIDFTAPDTSVALAELAAQTPGFVHVIGTTGFNATHEQAIQAAAQKAIIVKSGNMSVGVNLLAALTEKVAATLGPDFDIEILEMHHRHKVDAPSGTALLLGQSAAVGRKVNLDAAAVKTRDGHTGARPSGAIGFATLRGGSVVGEHTVMFAAEGERIELSHIATDRQIFARGALRAALWGKGRAAGLYSMRDVLGL